jgi:anaphase-promoting complex subunit 3
VYDLMRQFADAARALALYECDACLGALDRLPAVQQRSAGVMALVGRAHYAKTEYVAAERAFLAAKALEPHRVWDMEVFSTLLWHLQRPVQLSFLAQELLAIDARAPQAWIAVGNTFSAQRDREQARTCFARAAQLDPACAYAHTLLGHENVDDDPDKAVTHFQAALRADPRHYNAWCVHRVLGFRLAAAAVSHGVSVGWAPAFFCVIAAGF